MLVKHLPQQKDKSTGKKKEVKQTPPGWGSFIATILTPRFYLPTDVQTAFSHTCDLEIRSHKAQRNPP